MTIAVTVLPDGRLLASGGRIDDPAARSARLLDPRDGAFLSAGARGIVRSKHDAVVLASGKVLVFGGIEDWAGREKFTMPNWVVTSEVFDLATGTWSPR